jgi:hypothetical protein
MSAPPTTMEELGNSIRHWAHYDTMLATLNKQVKNVRDLRQVYEEKVLQNLKAANAENAVIQIAGGRVIVSEEKYTQPLSFKNLEIMLHQYYRQKPGAPDETTAILQFVRGQRQTQVSKCLKRQVTGTTPPALPPSGVNTGMT